MACVGCVTDYYQLIQEVYRKDESAKAVFIAHGVLPTEIIYPSFNRNCIFKPSKSSLCCNKVNRDSRGRKHQCRFNVSQRKGAWLKKPN